MHHRSRIASVVVALAFALALVLVLVLVNACGEPEPSPPPAAEVPSPAPAADLTNAQPAPPVAPAPAPETASGPPPEIARPFDENANAEADVRAALAQATQSGKRVLIIFGGNWCPWCRRLEHTLRNHPDVARAVAAGYHVVHVDSGRNEAIDARYGRPTQHGVPVLVVLAPDGSTVTTQETGSLEQGDRHDPARVLAFLQRFTAAP